MSDTLESWSRPHFTPTDGKALLFYAAFGALDLTRSLDRSRYRTNGTPGGFKFTSYARDTHSTVLAEFCQGYVWDELMNENPELAAQIEAAPMCVVLRGEVADPPTLDYLRDSVGMITYLFDAGACAVNDPQILRWWTDDEWRDEIFEPAGAVPRHHVTILISDEPDGAWIHTRGMRKFARPDVSVRRVGAAHADAVFDLCNRFIEFQAFGGLPADGQAVRMGSLPDGGVVHHSGSLDDPDFNNVHLEVIWPRDELAGSED